MLFQLNRRSGMLIEDQPNGKKKIKMLFALGQFLKLNCLRSFNSKLVFESPFPASLGKTKPCFLKKRQRVIGDILEHLGFAEALEQLLGEKRIQMLMMITTYAIVNSTRAFSALILLSIGF